MTQLETVMTALKNIGGKGSYKSIYAEFERIDGRPLTSGRKAGIRKLIEDHSSDSMNYKADNQDLFYAVYGIGKGTWGLR